MEVNNQADADNAENGVNKQPEELHVQVESGSAPADVEVKKRRFKHKKMVLIIAVTALVFGSGSAAATYFITRNGNSSNSSEQLAVSDANIPSVALDAKSVLELSGKIAGSYTWLDTPKQVEKLPLFKNPEGNPETDVEFQVVSSSDYYLIGSGNDGSEIYVVAGPDEPGGRPYNVVIKRDNQYSIIKNHSGSYFYSTVEGGPKDYHGPELLSGVTVDPTSTIPDMSVPEEITFKGQKFSTKYPTSSEPTYMMFMSKLPENSEFLNYQESGKINEGTIYESISKDDASYRVSSFELRIKPPFYMTLYLKGELSNQQIDPIVWNDGSKNSIDYQSAGRGCGSGNRNEIAKFGKDQLVQIGKSEKGQIIYGFKDTSNILLIKHHDEYIDDSKNIDQWIGGEETVYKKANFGLDINAYNALRPLYLVEDGIGRMLVFSRQDLVVVGGCAKPVIYAYPTVPTLIDVTVGADVTVSDPLYESGWMNVLAMPNGLLGYNGRQYDSLFWEGYGYGEYPEIHEGIVVERNSAEDTLRMQLAQLGLNEKETSDFMGFWAAKIPNTPYVRLTWLGTNDMERLAPLYVSPAPDTRIRVFLDMEGLETYQQMQPQRLTSTPRRGFTVVEWGGLVTDGSVPLLR